MNEKSSDHVTNYTPIVFTKKDHLMGRIEFFQPCYENSLRPLHKLTVWSCSTRCHKSLIKLCRVYQHQINWPGPDPSASPASLSLVTLRTAEPGID